MKMQKQDEVLAKS